MARLRAAGGSLWDTTVGAYGASFLSPFRVLGIRGAVEEGSLRPFVRRRPLPRLAQTRSSKADLPLDTARVFAAAVQGEPAVLLHLDTMVPIDAVHVTCARRVARGSFDVYYLCIVPSGDGAPEVCELTRELVERSRDAYNGEPESRFFPEHILNWK
jgi:hypothetical protein